MYTTVYQLQITLLQSNPLIWRKILVDPNTLLVDLHRIIQTTMGWTNSHLHEFKVKNSSYAPIEFEVENAKNSRTVKLSKVLKEQYDQMLYEYDFGDSWNHSIILEDFVSENENNQIPRCIGGARNCPPEDCGSMSGYRDLLQIISNPKHNEYKETITWLGGKFDPEYFDIIKINQLLKEPDFGCIWLED